MQKKLMGVHKVSAFHPGFFQQSGKSTIIRYLAVPHHFFLTLWFFFPGIHVDPGPYIVTSPENTYPRGIHGEIKVHRSNAYGSFYPYRVSDIYIRELSYTRQKPGMDRNYYYILYIMYKIKVMFLQNWYPRETSLLFTGRQM